MKMKKSSLIFRIRSRNVEEKAPDFLPNVADHILGKIMEDPKKLIWSKDESGVWIAQDDVHQYEIDFARPMVYIDGKEMVLLPLHIKKNSRFQQLVKEHPYEVKRIRKQLYSIQVPDTGLEFFVEDPTHEKIKIQKIIGNGAVEFVR